MKDVLIETAVQLIVAAVLTPVLVGVAALSHHHIDWWGSALFSLVIVFGGWCCLENSDWSD